MIENNQCFESDGFMLQVLTRGGFLDNGTHPGDVYAVEVTTVRLNYIALREWYDTYANNTRDTYETNEEWQQYQATKGAARKAFHAEVMKALGLEGTAIITQAHAEVFSVVQIVKLETTRA